MITKENPAAIEQKTANPPTLHLFRYKGPEMETLRAKVAAALQLEQNTTYADNSLHRLNAQKQDRSTRLAQTTKELSEQLDNTESSITCGAVYLKMRDELQELSPQELMTFFKQCLAVNTSLCEAAKARADKEKEQTTLLRTLNMKNSRQVPASEKSILDKMADNPPSWFKDDKTAWKAFVHFRANFLGYLNYDFLDLVSRSRTLLSKDVLNAIDALHGVTKKDEFPDWLLEGSEILPTKEEVEEELAEDEEQKIKTISAQKKIKEQGNYLVATASEKTEKAVERLRKLTREVFPSFQNFSDVVLFAKVADTKAVNLNINSGALEQIIKFYTSPDNVLTNQEPIALLIERKLREGNIIQSAQDPIDTHFISLFSLAFKHIKTQQKSGSTVAEFEALRATNKKAYDALKHDLKPFVEILPIDEISLLEDLLAESKDKSIELFIWDMAGAISSNFKEKGHMPNPRDLHDLGKFSASFLRNHSRWAYQQLQEGLAGKDQEPASTNIATMSDVQKEIETTTEEIAQGNLGGWHIFYATDELTDPNHLVEIGGTTIDEREEKLDKFFITEGIGHSIKTTSIMNALEEVPLIPEEVRWTKMKKVINGVEYVRTKRGAGRIFYHTDTENKRIIFFYYQKKSYEYRL